MAYLMNEIIKDIFKDFTVSEHRVPVAFVYYHGNEKDYVTWRQIDAYNSLSGDDELIGYADLYDFDIYCHANGYFKGNYEQICERVKELMKQNYFVFQPSRSSADFYETDTGYYHKTLCFGILREENI